MTATGLQGQLFALLKSKLPQHLSLVDEVSGVLGISNDSAYRRIRGEKTLTLDDVHKLCQHYKLSLDKLLNQNTNAFVFTGHFVTPTTFKFDEYLTNMGQQLKAMNAFTNKKMIYHCVRTFPCFSISTFASWPRLNISSG